jgi:hypothetical protein
MMYAARELNTYGTLQASHLILSRFYFANFTEETRPHILLVNSKTRINPSLPESEACLLD